LHVGSIQGLSTVKERSNIGVWLGSRARLNPAIQVSRQQHGRMSLGRTRRLGALANQRIEGVNSEIKRPAVVILADAL
jgi:hypothetical protein